MPSDSKVKQEDKIAFNRESTVKREINERAVNCREMIVRIPQHSLRAREALSGGTVFLTNIGLTQLSILSLLR